MNTLLNRLALVATVGLIALPVVAQDKMMDGKMSNDKMMMDDGKMMNDKMMMDHMDKMKMSSNQKMMMKKDMKGMSMMQKKGMMTNMMDGKMASATEMRRIAWYKKTYGGNWRNHYTPGV